MMIIQLILIAAFVIMMLRLLAKAGTHRVEAWKKLLALAFVVLAVVVILLPDLATVMANAVGVGRGADLLLYTLVAGAVFVSLDRYVADRKARSQIVVLARRLAILEAQERERLDRTGR